MCGINGYVATHPLVPGPWFADAVRVARHRGPDGAGYWVPGLPTCRPIDGLDGESPGSARAALGFSRLAILDLSPAGDQPMVVPGRAAMSYNGEIYNFVEIREELAALGWTFTSSGDAEVLLKAYLEWGTGAFSRFDGMWALGIYDVQREGLLIARDRFGEKPLFWTPWEGGLAFGSEVKQLAKYPGVSPRLDPQRAAAYLVTGRPYDGPSSWFAGIHQLSPGEWLWADSSGVGSGASYFDLEQQIANVSPEKTPADWCARFAELLGASVRRRLRSDVPVGTSLSSGVDSSLVLAEAAAQGHEGYRTFTASGDEPRIDEAPAARRFATSLGSVWQGVPADPVEFATIWDRMTWHHECPVAGTSLYGQWKVFEAASAAGVPVILDGQGADEILGGYSKFIAGVIWRTARTRPLALAVPVRGFIRQVGGLENLRTWGYRYLGRAGRAPRPADLLQPGLFEGDHAPRVRVSSLETRLQDIRRWSLPNLLAYADRNAMAHSVETRLPYLDVSVVALSLAMPDDILFRDGWTKWPLRVALAARAGRLPAWAPVKRGFPLPQARWLRASLKPAVDAWIGDPHPAWESVVETDRMRAFQAAWQERSPSFAWDDQVFKMVAFDRFLRVWFPRT
ncbi:MAG TPA: asparagine synthase (glutamine-hydrolyzing) [Candidatus Limnocylindrales bacterium]|nr:asparagine synthase (glutamine-hydrolyzing) [Candidatus Limnocylindrales bacterium]